MIPCKVGLMLITLMMLHPIVDGFNSSPHFPRSSHSKCVSFCAARTTTSASTTRISSKIRSTLYMKSESSTTSNNQIATLTDSTTWKLRFVMNGITTSKGRKTDELFVIQAKFLEDEGYEPPQGIVTQVEKKTDTSGEIDGKSENEEKKQNGLQLISGRWQLSEDPDDRKDGLWVSRFF